MRLHVGIIDESPGWRSLLLQEGISFSVITEAISVDAFSAVIAGRNITSQSVDWIRSYLSDGGSVLCTAGCYTQLTGQVSEQRFVKYVYPQPKTIFRKTEIIDLMKECRIPEGANELLSDSNRPSVFVGTFGKGYLIVLPFDAGELMLDQRVATKSFYARRSRLPFEQVSSVSKNGIRQLVSQSLEVLHHKRGLPYVHCWYFPHDAKNIFALRIDTDRGSRDEIRNLYGLLSGATGRKISASWFVDVKSQKHWLDEYASMEGQEIALHCYEHKRYEEYRSADEDIRIASDIMKKVSIHAKGFAAPYGSWNAEVGKAIETHGFDYSSEFSYDYDSIPSFPYVDERFSDVLQVPVHPVSIGSLRRQGCSEQEMKQYFHHILEKKISASEPLFFYHHPKDHHESVLEEIFGWIQKNGIQNMTMEAYARWWKKRQTAKNEIHLNGASLTVKTEKRFEDVWFHITRPEGTETFTIPNDTISLDALRWKSLPQFFNFSEDMLRARSFNPWISVIRIQDKLHNLFRG